MVDVWCGGCPILPKVWWLSGVVDVCVVDVVQSKMVKMVKVVVVVMVMISGGESGEEKSN